MDSRELDVAKARIAALEMELKRLRAAAEAGVVAGDAVPPSDPTACQSDPATPDPDCHAAGPSPADRVSEGCHRVAAGTKRRREHGVGDSSQPYEEAEEEEEESDESEEAGESGEESEEEEDGLRRKDDKTQRKLTTLGRDASEEPSLCVIAPSASAPLGKKRRTEDAASALFKGQRQSEEEISTTAAAPLMQLQPPKVQAVVQSVAGAMGKEPAAAAEAETTAVPRRKPPPLPVVKTSSTKKERYNLVAKCTEPKPGQTRYWTEDEHERFLEAVAEYGEKAYVAISNYVESRTPKQVRTHAQKFQMKMARLAKQSFEAGHPIQMPPGMLPIVPVGADTPATPPSSGSNAPVAVSGAPGASIGSQEEQPHQIAADALGQPVMSTVHRKPQTATRPADGLVTASSSISDDSSATLSDPYLNYVAGGVNGGVKDDMELENIFAAKLPCTLQSTASDIDSHSEDLLSSDRSSSDSGSMANLDEEDDLEDLEDLQDGDLALTPFSNPSESWLLPEDTMAAASG